MYLDVMMIIKIKLVENYGSLGPDMKPNLKVIFFYAYQMPNMSSAKKLLKNIVKQKSLFQLIFEIFTYIGPSFIAISFIVKIYYTSRFTFQSIGWRIKNEPFWHINLIFQGAHLLLVEKN